MKLHIALTIFILSVCNWGNAYSEERDGYTYNAEIGSWLKLHEPASWQEAVATCLDEGALIASPLDDRFKKALVSVMLGNRTSHVYTGVHDIYYSGLFYSMEGKPIAEFPVEWAAWDLQGDCVVLRLDGKIFLQSCLKAESYICYKADTGSTNECNSPYSGYKWDHRTGSFYKRHQTRATWTDAFRICVEEGGQLPIINSVLEAEVLRESSRSLPVGFVAFGKHPVRKWLTIHGETLAATGYALWAPGEPNGPVEERCGSIVSGDASVGLLNDAPCNFLFEFVCERKPKFDNVSSSTTAKPAL